jgi:hypothetical protein
MGGVERLAGAEAFASAGALHPIAVLTRPEVAVCRREFAGIERALGGPQLRLDWPHLFFAWAHELATHPTVLDTMETLLGPDILIWGSMISQKPPRTSYHFDWHQDSAFNSFLTGVPAATAWIALTESTPHNGCLQVVPGSHRRALVHEAAAAGDNMLRQKQRAAVTVEAGEAEDVILRAGEMLVQDMRLLHASGANDSARPRIGLIVRFATPEIKHTLFPLVRARGCRAVRDRDFRAPPPDNDVARGLRGRAALIEALEGRR